MPVSLGLIHLTSK